jgi:nifR3 family TIM-barrel protein
MNFSPSLQEKINHYSQKRVPIQLGSLSFASDLIQAPMASICNAPFRRLMEDLGAGGTVSELISCHAIHHGNKKTRNMMVIHPEEKNVGLQLFGEGPEMMAEAAKVCESLPVKPKFIDINMGCPVPKVVNKGAGAALLKDPEALRPYLIQIKEATSLPVTVKIRTGWDQDSITAQEIADITHELGIEFLSIHGRTRAQKYMGLANWDLLNHVASQSQIPIVGNGDLHHASSIIEKQKTSSCQAFMIARGSIRNPFIFLEALEEDEETRRGLFSAEDHLEVIHRLGRYMEEHFEAAHVQTIQLKKHASWFAQGYPHTAKFRQNVFTSESMKDLYSLCDDYFLSLQNQRKNINYAQSFMTSGHG